MKKLEKNIKSHPTLSIENANTLRDLQINFNQAEDALTIPAKSRHDHKCGSATQCGRSMIEMLGVLAIIGVLSVGGIAGYSKAMMKYRINKTIEQITLIAGNVRTFFAPQGNYDGLNSTDTGKAIIKKAKLVPDEMWDGGEIKNVWGGITHIYHSIKGGGTKNFTIDMQEVPNEACIELFSQDWSDLKVTYLCKGGPEKCLPTPIALDKIVSLCEISNTNNEGHIWFGFEAANLQQVEEDASLFE